VAVDDKTPRTLLIADHLWEALDSMAVEMGSDREALVNQALYTFARLNGFLLPTDQRNMAGPADGDRPRSMPAPPVPASAIAPPPPAEEPPPEEMDGDLLGEEAHATSMDLPNLAAMSQPASRPAVSVNQAEEISEVSEAGQDASGRTLVLFADGRELDQVVKDRFLIGRGKHCDLIINSGKVSREHAAITREGDNYFIEDLGSSNGTWFDKRRISRRQIQDGDEYFICAEKLSCVFR
jgi:hypothetical protein